MCHSFAEELDEVQRHHSLLKELQKLAFDGMNKFTQTHFDVFITQILEVEKCKNDPVFRPCSQNNVNAEVISA